MLELITPISYWLLCLLWLIILALYLGKLKHEKAVGGTVAVLLTLLSVDAFRTLFESVYFGLYFNSMFGLLPHAIYDVLSRPGLIIIPKILNIVAAIIIITLLIRRWVPNEIQAREEKIKQLEDSNAKLNESETRFRTLVEKIPVPLIHMRKDGQNIFRNEHFVQLFGYTEEIVSTVDEWWMRAYPDPDYRARVIRIWEQAVEQAVTQSKDIEKIEVLITCHSGEQRLIEVSGIVMEDEVLVTFIDLTERRQTQAAVEKGRAELEAIFNCIADGIVFVDPQRCIVRINPVFTKIFGYELEEIVGQTTELIYANPEHYGKQGKARFNPEANIERPVFENEYRRKDGTTFTGETIGVHVVDESGTLLGYIGVIHDISERQESEEKQRELESQLRQKYKMEAVGVMAGGMAHNFNNNLTIILGNLELSKVRLPPQNEVGEYLENAKIATVRSQELVRQIMAYSRTGDPSQRPVQLSLLLNETISLLKSTIPSSIKLQQEVKPDCEQVYIQADSSQIQECLLNLCNNAVHAMAEQGELLLTLERLQLKQEDISPRYDCSPGEYICLSVQDNGCGIPAEIQEKIFDPFFTTKELYDGTGMGLSTVQGIVEQHHGIITVASGVGQGATFHLYFPIIEHHQKAEVAGEEAELQMGTERILYVDDDEMIATLNERLLSEMGYRVTVMTDSMEAMKLFRSDPDNFDLIMTDQTMPELTGLELIQKIKILRPDIPTILSTGYSSKVNEEEARQAGISAFLTKPTDVMTLSQVIKNVLEKSSVS